jgi:glutamine amidotransferase
MNKKIIVGIVDTGTSNIKSVRYALEKVNVKAVEIKEFDNTKIDAMVVPGVGSFKNVMERLKKKKLDKFILQKISNKLPSLFICIGMQILFSKSYEFGETKGLDIIKGTVNKFLKKDNNNKIKIPFIGWNTIRIQKFCPIFKSIQNNSFCYFTHSYYVKPDDEQIVSSSSCNYDFEYTASISIDNIMATQFHPEKSGAQGIKMFKNFINNV